MIDRTEIKIRLSKLYKSDEPHNISEDDDFDIDLGMDSLDFLEYQASVQDEFKLSVSDSFFDNVHTVGQLINKVYDELNSKEVNDNGQEVQEKEQDKRC